MKHTTVMAAQWLGAFVALLVAALVVVLVAPSAYMPGRVCAADSDGQVLTTDDYSQAPAQVVADAATLAASYFPRDSAKAADMQSQLIGTYLAAASQDFVVIFNPGGWGWDPMSQIPGWESIMYGIQNTLKNLGYKAFLIDFERTSHGFAGIVGELEELSGIQPMKAQELADRVNFLTQHLPDLRVIITGESNGAIIADDALRLLKDNPRVFAIESGPPFWHTSLETSHSLVIQNNGEQPDAFSTGNIILILRANLESAFGIYKGSKGDILLYIGAPGHYYSWDYPVVREQVEDFLTHNFAS